MQRWQRAKEVFEQALERPPAERSGHVASACGADQALRAEVESLLAELDEAGSFLETPAAAWVAPEGSAITGEPAPCLAPGSQLGPYEIRALIGRGGMGEVYRAWDGRLGREVALKILLPEVASLVGGKSRFEKEARAASALNHPAILTIHDIGDTGAMLYIVTELVRGRTLRELLKNGPLPVSLLLSVAAQLGAGLASAHAAGVVHRDLKPENVMLTEDQQVRILDFGLAKVLGQGGASPPEVSTLGAGRLMGTVAYMSPEQARGEPVDLRSDQFSLGALLHELATGKAAFRRDSLAESLAATLHEQPPALSGLRPAVPVELQRVIERCLAKDPEARYASTEQLAGELERVRLQAMPSAPTLTLPVQRSVRRRPWLMVAAGLVPLAAVGLSWFNWAERSVPPFERSVSAAPGPSLAVLPFSTLDGGGAGADEDLGLGMADALITRFARTRRVRVRPTSAVRDYNLAGGDPLAAGRALGVEAVLDGRLHRAERIRVTLQLLRVRDGALLWADTLDERFTGILDLQDSIADKVMRALSLVLTRDETQRLRSHATDNTEAYRSYLKGRHYWNQRNEPSVRKALAHFEKALDLDAGYAQAWAGISDSYMVLAPAIPPREAFPLAKAAARRALAIDDTLAEAHASLGHVEEYLWQWEAAEAAYKRAIDLDPGYATAYHWYGGLLAALSRTREAIAALESAHEYDPLSSMINADLGLALVHGGQFQRAVDHCGRQLQLNAAFSHTHRCVALGLVALGRHAEAISHLEKAEALGSPQRESLAHAYGLSGRTREAREMLAQLARRQAGFVSPFGIALVHVSLGEPDRAFAALEEAYAIQDGELLAVAVDPRLRPLHGDPRFRGLLRRMRLRLPAETASPAP